MTTIEEETYWIRIYLSGRRDVIDQGCREFCEEGLCVTVESCKFIYTGGEEEGVVVGMVNYPKFPMTSDRLDEVARRLAEHLLCKSLQHSALIVNREKSIHLQRRERRLGE